MHGDGTPLPRSVHREHQGQYGWVVREYDTLAIWSGLPRRASALYFACASCHDLQQAAQARARETARPDGPEPHLVYLPPESKNDTETLKHEKEVPDPGGIGACCSHCPCADQRDALRSD
ncbi:hypothetical protein Rmet_6531 [Cupriavidus metallidurans CH34]|uniref:Uncharacterized protein n=1 Tax=Cupriavidus metallidurans (strain ATCC 43123 / DSM 2839 / NBRC 102507 / CH34) TaxID=266264 RepID=D3DXW8_CUPMC|nr:hypothetical protein Rmet_6531 [Cupriavidus metallidurans CH34]